MTLHRLAGGVELISSLTALGVALGYEVRTEDKLGDEAVDVAWFAKPGQRFPLFIFEVESRLTNSATSNAMKVFGNPNEELEKPLFFFHIFLRGGQRSPKIRQLRNQYGSHNYRIYRVDLDEANLLLRDVLSQHARLTDRIDIVRVGKALVGPWWARQPHAIDAALAAIAALDFEGRHGTLLPGYARLAATSDRYLTEFLSCLRARITASAVGDADYPTYLGHFWQTPIHLALLSAAYPTEASDYLALFSAWQGDTSGPIAIGPHFGLSQDYDQFVIGQAPSLLVLLGCLMREPEAQRYLYAQLQFIMNGLRRASSAWTFVAVWLLLLSGHSGSLEMEYEDVRSLINDHGGVPGSVLREPPAAIDLDDDAWLTADRSARRAVPSLTTFRSVRSASVRYTDAELRRAMRLAISALTVETAGLYWERELLAILGGFPLA